MKILLLKCVKEVGGRDELVLEEGSPHGGLGPNNGRPRDLEGEK